MFNFLRSASDF